MCSGGGFIKTRTKRKIGIRLIAIGLMLIGVFILVDMRIRPIIIRTSAYQCQILASRIINQALIDELSNASYDYNSLVLLTVNESGEVKSVSSNMQSINRLKAQSTQLINEAIKDIDAHQLGIAVGTVSGIHMFYGKGPMIPISLTPKGYANTTLISEFSSAGINQTLHRIVLRVTVDISAIIPGYTSSVVVDSDFVVAETVIVGNIPNSYTHIISGNSDVVDDIADYNAEDMARR